MRVLHTVSSMDPVGGGVCQAIRDIVLGLENLGFHNEVACLDEPQADFIAAENFPVHAMGKSCGRWAKNPMLSAWLKTNLENFDAVIIHGLWQFQSYAVTKAVRSLRDRKTDGRSPHVFVMPHGMLDPWFQKDPSRRVKAIRNTLYWKLIEHRTIENADAVLFTCQKELELAREPFRPYRPKQELNVGLGVAPPPPFDPAMQVAFRKHLPELSDRGYLLFLSRIHPKKGVDLLIRAYDRVRGESQSRDDFPALVIAGPTDSAYAQGMISLTCELDLDDIHFCGMLRGNEKWGALYGCEAFVLPSHQENFGIAVVEALACGRPVLISDQVNIYGEIKSAGAGLMASDDLEGACALLRRWIQMSAEDKALMSNQTKHCYEKFFLPSGAALSLAASLTGSTGFQTSLSAETP